MPTTQTVGYPPSLRLAIKLGHIVMTDSADQKAGENIQLTKLDNNINSEHINGDCPHLFHRGNASKFLILVPIYINDS